jgi:hypothetical protein
MNNWNALFTGTILGNTYSLLVSRTSNVWNAEMYVAAPGGEVIHSFTRSFDSSWMGFQSIQSVKRAMLREAREDLA